jgi:hypothetical protein
MMAGENRSSYRLFLSLRRPVGNSYSILQLARFCFQRYSFGRLIAQSGTFPAETFLPLLRSPNQNR